MAIPNTTYIISETAYSTFQTWKPPTWMQNYTAVCVFKSKFNKSQANIPNVLSQLQNVPTGQIYITSLTLPNPYLTLPPYWDYLVSEITTACQGIFHQQIDSNKMNHKKAHKL